MKIRLVLADVARPGPATAHLLNAGWTYTTAEPRPDGVGYAVPQQALAVFIEAAWDELNRPLALVADLVDDDGVHARMSDGGGELVDAHIEQEIWVAGVPGAPNGTPGSTTFLVDIPGGLLVLGRARARYLWRVSIAGATDEVGFWVNLPPSGPSVGFPPGS